MGEEAWRVHQTGAPSLDHLRLSRLLGKDDVEARLGVDLTRPPLVVAMHPVTLDPDPAAESVRLLDALADVDERIVFCFPNADAGGRTIRDRAVEFCAARDEADMFVNLEPQVFWSLLACAGAIVGNSSSGIMEAASLALPAVDIGRRQQGRERAENVLWFTAFGTTTAVGCEGKRWHSWLRSARLFGRIAWTVSIRKRRPNS